MSPVTPCLLLMFLLAPALCAADWPGFEIERELPAQKKPAPKAAPASPKPRESKQPWGLWANRAPYPFYDGPFTIDTDDDVVARDMLIDFETGMWLAPGDARAAYAQLRAHIGLFFLDASYLQVTRTSHEASLLGPRVIKDWSEITLARGHFGVAWPIPKLGYIEGGVGVGGFDQTSGISGVGFSLRSSVLIYPIWPLGLEAYASRLQFLDGRGVNEFGFRLHIQVFRHLFITGGWHWLNVDGGGFGAHGMQFGLSFTFGNLRTFFWAPMRGPAY